MKPPQQDPRETPLSDEDIVRPVAPPEQVPPASDYSPYIVGGFVGGAVLLVLGLAYWRWKRRAGIQKSPPLDEWALAELRELDSWALTSQEEVERYHARLAQVLIACLRFRFDLPAREYTTAELLTALKPLAEVSPELQAEVRDILGRCDRVKFARLGPGPEESRKLAECVRSWLQVLVQ